MRFYELDSVPYGTSRYSGEYRAERKWGLPGLQCPTCNRPYVDQSEAYPGVDLSGVPEAKQLEAAWLESDAERFMRLREVVRPLVPAWAPLVPGAHFGPLVGTARGNFPQLYMRDRDRVIIRRDALEQLQAAGVRGLEGYRTEIRFRQRNAPELMELHVEMPGLLHPDCIPQGKATPCETCGGYRYSMPIQPLLDRASLPEHLDVFRLRNSTSVIVLSERFVDTLRRLGFEEFSLRELPVR